MLIDSDNQRQQQQKQKQLRINYLSVHFKTVSLSLSRQQIGPRPSRPNLNDDDAFVLFLK
jgi:hypothetical protein